MTLHVGGLCSCDWLSIRHEAVDRAAGEVPDWRHAVSEPQARNPTRPKSALGPKVMLACRVRGNMFTYMVTWLVRH